MNYTAGILVVALIAFGGYIFPKSESATFFLGGDSTNFTELGTTELKVGTDCDDSGTYDSCEGSVFTEDGDASVGLFTEGGGTVTIAQTAASTTVTEAQLLAGNIITLTASSTMPANTLILPATSTLTTLIPDDGDMHRFVYINPFSGAATTTTIQAGTGIDLQEPDGQNVVVAPTNIVWFTMIRKANTDVIVLVDESIPAD